MTEFALNPQASDAKKICIVSPSLKIGGIERALTVLANYFVAKGISVTFISCLTGEHFYQLHNAVVVIEPTFKRSSSSIDKIFHYLKTALFIRRSVKKVKPDVVMSFGDNFNPLVLFSLLGTKYPVFISDRTSPTFRFSPAIKVAKRLLYPRAQGFIAQTNLAAEFKRQQFGERLNMRIIPNAIKSVNITEGPREKWIVCVARLSREKGVDRLIKSFALIDDKKDWKVVVVGSGPDEMKLKTLVSEEGLSEHVLFTGRTTDIDAILSKGGMFVLPSHVEGFPNALCEAMSAGLPSICFDSIPFAGIIQPDINGFVVRDNDLPAMAAAIQKLITDDELRKKIGERARFVRDEFSVSRIGEQYLDFLLGKAS